MTIYTGPVFEMARAQFQVIAEWVQDLQQFFWDEAEVMTKLYHVLQKAFGQVMARAERDGVSHRTAAMAIGVQKVQNAKMTRGLFP